MRITSTQVRMRAHNQGCVASLCQRFSGTNGRLKKIVEKLLKVLRSYFAGGVRHLQRKGKRSRSRIFIFFPKSGTKKCHGSKRMISARKCSLMCALHTLENCAKSADRNVPLHCAIFKRSVVKLLQILKRKHCCEK